MVAFMRRNLILKTHRAKKIDSKRVTYVTTAVIKPWFDYLRILVVLTISSENRYNIDETGLIKSQGTNGLVVRDRRNRSTQKKQPRSRTWTTIVEYISAKGRILFPLVIFKRESVQQQ